MTLRPPIDGTTLEEVLTKVRRGEISAMVTKRGSKGDVVVGTPTVMGEGVPEALQAVTLKAMARERAKRYASVEMFAGDIEAYQNGFATSAEDAGAWKRVKLWVGRNKVLAGSAAVLVVVVSGFTARVVQKGREASEALQSLRETAPTFAVRAQDALRAGQFEEALKAATFAVKLERNTAEYHALQGDILEVLVRWPEAMEAYKQALRLGAVPTAQENLVLMEQLIVQSKMEGETPAKMSLFESLNQQKRHSEAMEFGKGLGDFWKVWKDRRKDISALPELVKRLETKLLAVPGADVHMSSTELTVGEWKLYIRAEGLPEWQQPQADQFIQTDEHPVVKISWNKAKEFCEWLSEKTGKDWRLPTSAEWEAAVGHTEYPWGEYFPPKWDDGNYAAMADGKKDRLQVGLDGVKGTAPVGSFNPNALGFYDLGGNVAEWMWEEVNKTNRILRGGAWNNGAEHSRTSDAYSDGADFNNIGSGLRLVRRSGP